MAPRPTTSVIWYLPIRSICAIRGLLFEHLHRLSDAFLHAVEGVGERADLVPGAQMEVGDEGLVDDAHGAAADHLGDLVLADPFDLRHPRATLRASSSPERRFSSCG